MNNSQKQQFKGTILVVDDTPDNLRLLSSMLAEQSYKVRAMLNGEMALKSAQADPPDLIFLDVNMPHPNGYEVCKQLKASEKTRQIPVIFISALNEALDKVTAFQSGGIDYITKPFQFEEVLARLETHLRIQWLQQQLQEQNQLLLRERELLKKEQEKSETLLLNILPRPIAEQLKNHPHAIAEQFDEVTILFADIVEFTPLASRVSAAALVERLNRIFSAFDQLTEEYGLEKIKTVGDEYMVVGGLPVPRRDHAEAIAQLGLAMQDKIASFNRDDGQPFQLRIGINTGAVVAGVIGVSKFSYDLWGDAVNVASRMESTAEPGKIQVTAVTYERLKEHFTFEERGYRSIKGKSEMMTYWLSGKKSTCNIQSD